MTLTLPETDWDYRTESTNRLTHGIHPYPAKMVPQVAERLIRDYGEEDGLLFDPYCGSGTSLLEANLAGMRAVGTDLNPLARLISRVKTSPIEPNDIDDLITDFDRFSSESTRNGHAVARPTVLNLDYWFSPPVVEQLASIRCFIAGIDDRELNDFARVAFSSTIRECSWTKKSEFKLVRMSADQLDGFEPAVIDVMARTMETNRKAVASLHRSLPLRFGETVVHSFNTVEAVPEYLVAPESVDLIVTSPPYGDSQTTVAYGQFSRFSNQWLGFPNTQSLDTDLMGGRRGTVSRRFGIDILDDIVDEVSVRDGKRGADVASFFRDYAQSIANVAGVLRTGGVACYVVGNRTVRSVTIPTDEITVALFEGSGFDFVTSHERNIPNKRMPYSNSPTNVVGENSPTIRRETVIVCRKR